MSLVPHRRLVNRPCAVPSLSQNAIWGAVAPELRKAAVSYLLEDAERTGLALSKGVQRVVECQCVSLFNYERDPAAAVAFSRSLKEIAVRLFRQRRYREADSRYRMASLFNPADPTLVSNRATCMYNLEKYRYCVDLCLDCVSQYPTMFCENPMLYFKVLLRMGRANIELRNFSEAQATYDALVNMKDGHNPSNTANLPKAQFEQLLQPFHEHLKSRVKYASKTNGAAPLQELQAEGNAEEDSQDEADDENVQGIIELSDLCPHIHECGEGECFHDFPVAEHGPNCNCLAHDGVGSENVPGSPSVDNDLPSLVSSSGEELSEHSDPDDVSEDSNMPDLVSDEDDASESTTDGDDGDDGDLSDDDGSWDDDGKLIVPMNSQRIGNALSAPKSNLPKLNTFRTSDLQFDWQNAWKEQKASKGWKNAVPASSQIDRSVSPALPSLEKSALESNGFKRGFLESQSLMPVEHESSSVASAGKRVLSITPSDKWHSKCYESDEECGPVGSGMFVERGDEDKFLLDFEKMTRKGPALNSNFDASSCLREILGKSFHTNRTVDFTRLFGHHQSGPSTGKKKKKSCDKHCGTCFARRMWKLRFLSSDTAEAKNALAAIETDSRRDHQTFLSGNLWQGTGYYASGYEMAFDMPALVHGVAYACLLQSELHWRGEKISFVRDIQHSFIAGVERKFNEQRNIHFLFMIFFMLRDTVNLFGLFPEPKNGAGRGSRSFQFSRSACIVAEKLLPVEGGGPTNHEVKALLGSRSESLTENMHRWSVVGQIEKEEEWVYNILLRDISHLMMSVTSTLGKGPSYLEGETFSEAFEKACGERSNDEKYWKNRAVTIISRERGRLMERKAFYEAKGSGDLDRSASIYTVAIQARPRQARLYYRRALVRSEQGKLRECLNDIHKGIALVNERPHGVMSTRCDSPQKCLLQSFYVLEGDTLSKRSGEPGHLKMETTKEAIACYTRALHLKSDEARIRDMVQTKLEIAKNTLKEAQLLSSQPLSRTKKPASKKPSTLKSRHRRNEDRHGQGSSRDPNIASSATSNVDTGSQKPTGEPKVDEESSSSDDDSDSPGAYGGNRYGALLGSHSQTLAQNRSRPTRATPGQSTGNIEGWETVKRGLARGSNTTSPLKAPSVNTTPPIVRTATRSRGAVGQASSASDVYGGRIPASLAVSNRHYCELCNVSFRGPRDYSSHLRGRRHRTALATARASGVVSVGLQGDQESSRNRAPSNDNTAPGPTLQEASTEAERAMAILGGEARPSDVVSRMNFSRWNVHDVNGYLEVHFGGLLQICNQHPHTFEVVHARSRTMIVLVDRTEFTPSRRSRVAHGPNIVLGSSASQPSHQGASSPEASISLGNLPAASGTRNLQRGGRLVPQVPTSLNPIRKEKSVIRSLRTDGFRTTSKDDATGVYEEGECGICFDSKEDVRIIPCHHKWCERCIMANLAKGRLVCPSCNGQVLHLERLSSELD